MRECGFFFRAPQDVRAKGYFFLFFLSCAEGKKKKRIALSLKKIFFFFPHNADTKQWPPSVNPAIQ